MAKGDGVKNETELERKERMRGVVVASPDDMKGAIFAPSPNRIQNLLNYRGGTPPCFATAEELVVEVKAYFMSLIEPVLDEDGVVIAARWVGKPTISGLATFLGCSRQTIWEYSTKSDERAYVIKNAKNLIAEYAENAMLSGGNPAAYINYLINLRMETPWIADEKTIKVEPVLPDNKAKSTLEIANFLDSKALPESEIKNLTDEN